VETVKKLVIVAIILSFVSAAVWVAPRVVRPATLVGSFTLVQSNIDASGEVVKEGSYYVFSIAVDKRDEIIYRIKPPEVEIEADLTENIPPGSNLLRRWNSRNIWRWRKESVAVLRDRLP